MYDIWFLHFVPHFVAYFVVYASSHTLQALPVRRHEPGSATFEVLAKPRVEDGGCLPVGSNAVHGTGSIIKSIASQLVVTVCAILIKE